jgi:hypothetical protein
MFVLYAFHSYLKIKTDMFNALQIREFYSLEHGAIDIQNAGLLLDLLEAIGHLGFWEVIQLIIWGLLDWPYLLWAEAVAGGNGVKVRATSGCEVH